MRRFLLIAMQKENGNEDLTLLQPRSVVFCGSNNKTVHANNCREIDVIGSEVIPWLDGVITL